MCLSVPVGRQVLCGLTQAVDERLPSVCAEGDDRTAGFLLSRTGTVPVGRFSATSTQSPPLLPL